jgi:hypothetical protein
MREPSKKFLNTHLDLNEVADIKVENLSSDMDSISSFANHVYVVNSESNSISVINRTTT